MSTQINAVRDRPRSLRAKHSSLFFRSVTGGDRKLRNVRRQNVMETDFSKKDIAGVLFQYPDTEGSIADYTRVVDEAKKYGVSETLA